MNLNSLLVKNAFSSRDSDASSNYLFEITNLSFEYYNKKMNFFIVELFNFTFQKNNKGVK